MRKRVVLLTCGWAVDFVTRFIRGMNLCCQNNDIDLYVFSCYKFFEPNGAGNITGFSIFDIIDYKKFDGVVIMPNYFNDRAIVEREKNRILKAKIPAVSVSEPLENFHYVCSYNHPAYKSLVNHLIEEHNISDFAFIGGPDGNLGAESNLNAFKEALTEHHIPIDPENLYLHGDWTETFGYIQAQKIFQKEKIPQAIVCVNDDVSIGVCRVAVEHGVKIPDDLKIIGFDQIDIAQKVIPSISTVDLNPEAMGKAAIELIIKNPKEKTTVNVPSELIIGQSCGCINKITSEQMLYSLEYSKLIDDGQRFTSQLRHMEDVFIKYETVSDLSSNLQKYFETRHQYEGDNFAILLKDEVVKTMNSEKIENETTGTFGNKMVSFVNIKNGVPAKLEKINTKQLIPSSMKDDKPTLYLFMPIYNQKFVHGYYVAKNSLILMKNKNAYNWTRNIGTNIEKFRQTSIYKSVSQQLEILSTRDSLSGLLNRTGMDKYAEKLFNQNNKEGKKTQIIFADINDMKIINDVYGHLHGDLAVKTVAEVILKSIPSNYIGIRYGGDEFVIIGAKKDKKDLCKIITEQLIISVEAMALPYVLSVSLGEKIFEPDEKLNLLDAIKSVDEIMYKAKELYHEIHK